MNGLSIGCHQFGCCSDRSSCEYAPQSLFGWRISKADADK